MEQQLAAGLGERQVTEFVEDQQIDTAQAISNAALAAEFHFALKPVDQIDDVEEARPLAGPDDAARDADGQMRFSRAGRSSVTMPGVWRLKCGSSIRSIHGLGNWCSSNIVGALLVRTIWSWSSRTGRWPWSRLG